LLGKEIEQRKKKEKELKKRKIGTASFIDKERHIILVDLLMKRRCFKNFLQSM